MSDMPALELLREAANQAATSSAAFATIRGRQLDLSALTDPRLQDSAYRDALRKQIRAAQPFSHVVVDGWFNPTLLELVHEEFDSFDRTNWKVVKDENQLLHRSVAPVGLGPASQLYFGIVNSGWFVKLLAEITDIEDLMADAHLFGGGLHETRPGGKFAVHRDFDRHVLYGVDNKMVFITYLNKSWDPAWGGALELWGGEPKQCVRKVEPEFGRSILLLHGADSFHGHPDPMTAPDGRTRRSVASYYYRNAQSVQLRMKRVSSVFMVAHRSKRLRRMAWRLMPPILMDAIRRLLGR